MFLTDKLSRPPRPSDRHLCADYVELLCLFDPTLDGVVSKSDVLDRMRRARDTDAPDEDDSGDGTIEESSSSLPVDERLEQRVVDWFAHVRYRKGAFGRSYPFALSDDGDALLRSAKLPVAKRLYVFFLLAANTRCVSDSARARLYGAFELTSLAALRRYLPGRSKIHLFGKNSLGWRSRYTGHKLEKIQKLAGDLHESVHPKLSTSSFEDEDTGDAGLDVVGWLPFAGDDTAEGMLAVFCQCACSKKEWVRKQIDSSPASWRNCIPFTVDPSNMMFIPFCFRTPTGAWHRWHDIKQSILVDRLRLMRLLVGKRVNLSKAVIGLVDSILSETGPA